MLVVRKKPKTCLNYLSAFSFYIQPKVALFPPPISTLAYVDVDMGIHYEKK